MALLAIGVNRTQIHYYVKKEQKYITIQRPLYNFLVILKSHSGEKSNKYIHHYSEAIIFYNYFALSIFEFLQFAFCFYLPNLQVYLTLIDYILDL